MKNPELAFDLDETRLARGAAPVPPIPEPLGPTDFQHFLAQANAASAGSLRSWLDLAEAWRIRQALADCRGNRTQAAQALGIGRRTLYTKMEKLAISPR
ncbi:MAG: hypothetical protein OSB70_17435 [Myxococcota bacterium]|nr:hypothetical protein [Myxococcota bacterium]